MADPPLGHQRQSASTGVDGSTVIAGELITRLDRPVEHLGAMVAQAVDHVAFGHDARDPARRRPPAGRRSAFRRASRPHRATVASAAMVATSLPLSAGSSAMVIAPPEIRSRCASLDTPTSRRQREGHAASRPHPEPASARCSGSSGRSCNGWRCSRSPSRRSPCCWSPTATNALHIHMLIATALGAGLTVLLGTR